MSNKYLCSVIQKFCTKNSEKVRFLLSPYPETGRGDSDGLLSKGGGLRLRCAFGIPSLIANGDCDAGGRVHGEVRELRRGNAINLRYQATVICSSRVYL